MQMTFKANSKLVARVLPSPNHDARTSRIDILLMHYTGMQTGEMALARLTDRQAGVSCHYFVHEDGRIDQLVREARRAWHAGAASWKGATDINARSIGIEVVNPGHEYGYRDFPDAQIDALIKLCRDIVARHPIRRERVLAHSDVAPAQEGSGGAISLGPPRRRRHRIVDRAFANRQREDVLGQRQGHGRREAAEAARALRIRSEDHRPLR
jgi:N-acetylmuramoyl-L-alanine amidase